MIDTEESETSGREPQISGSKYVNTKDLIAPPSGKKKNYKQRDLKAALREATTEQAAPTRRSFRSPILGQGFHLTKRETEALRGEETSTGSNRSSVAGLT